MMDREQLHTAQASVLRTLRHKLSARYTELRQPTGLESDVFKFHLRKLQHLRYVSKLDSGEYTLTPRGKEFANSLSKLQRAVQKQPKLSMAIIASRKSGDAVQYLFQERLRSPFYGFWGCVSGPVQWGESIEAAAQREFEKQTGLAATYTVRGFYRKTDYVTGTDELLEDKLFAIVEATDVRGDITNEWQKGLNAWMTCEELKDRQPCFSSTYEFITMLERGEHYRSQTAHYTPDKY